MILRPHACALLTCGAITLYGTQAFSSTPSSLLQQVESIPHEFQEYFFDVPLAVRIIVDRKVLGEALVALSRDDYVTLIEFTDIRDSYISASEREKWKLLLQEGVSLGECMKICNGLVAVHYNLRSSELSILSNNVESDLAESENYELPDNSGHGVILQSQLNLSGGELQETSGSYGLEAISSFGSWTQTMSAQLNKDGYGDDRFQHSIDNIYAQKEWPGSYVRIGYFVPDAIGLSRTPRSFGASPHTTLGVMIGSSDTLVKGGAKPSIYPIYVTANRDSTVEIFRNGVLINVQPVSYGLQALDTKSFPNGIYEVEARLVEDGKIMARTTEFVYKPNNWSNPNQRWRYNLFAGRDSKILSSIDKHKTGSINSGAAANYLLHPRAVVGTSVQQIYDQYQLGTSLDVGLSSRSTLYTSVYKTQKRGTGLDIQALHDYGSGNFTLSHNISWLDNRDTWVHLGDGQRVRQKTFYAGNVSTTSLGVSHRLGSQDTLNSRISYSEGNTQGIGIDAGWYRSSKFFGNDANWRLSGFDRPGSFRGGNERSRGIDLSLSLSLGDAGRRLSASVASSTSVDGNTDRNVALGYEQNLTSGPISSVSATVQSGTHGVGVIGSAQFDTNVATGYAQVQRSSYNDAISGSISLTSNLMISGKNTALTGQYLGAESGMIIDVISDVDQLELRADDLSGTGLILKPGRNVLPVQAYKSGVVQFDFVGNDTPSATIQPARTLYHLNKGGVSYNRVVVSKTYTLFARLLDANGVPMKGMHVLNHSSRGVTEVDGFFSIELSANTPTLKVVRGEEVICHFSITPKDLPIEENVLMAGDLRCVDSSR